MVVYELGVGIVVDGFLVGILFFFSNLFSGGVGGVKDDVYFLDSLVEMDMKYMFIWFLLIEGVDDYFLSIFNFVIVGEGVFDVSGKVKNVFFIKIFIIV